MVRERGDWEKYRDRLLRQVKEFEKMKAAFDEKKAKFESNRKSEEWSREGLRASFVLLRISWRRSLLIGRKFVKRTISVCMQLARRLLTLRPKLPH
ncbi:hypothetical protein Hanom_Chr08g00714201 [Helianthus anomalus]